MNAPAELPDLSHLWMPFTANKQFKAHPRMLASAKGMYYTSADGRQVLDGTAGLWCVNAGHGRQEIVEAISRRGGRLWVEGDRIRFHMPVNRPISVSIIKAIRAQEGELRAHLGAPK